MTRLLIIGAGAHGQAVAEAALLTQQYAVVGFLDDVFPEIDHVLDIPILGKVQNVAAFKHEVDHACVAIGNNGARERVASLVLKAGIALATIVHPTAFVSPRARVDSGVVIMAGALVGTLAELGKGVILNAGAVVDHHCKVGDYGHLGVGACMAGGTLLGRGAWMQAGSTLKYHESIGDGQVIACAPNVFVP